MESTDPFSSSPSVRSWRTAFLTLRDETLISPPPTNVVQLLQNLIFSQSSTLIEVSTDLPPHEVTSDLMLLMELAQSISSSDAYNVVETCMQLSHLVYSVINCISIKLNHGSWPLVIDFLSSVVETFFQKAKTNRAFISNVAIVTSTKQCLEIAKRLLDVNEQATTLSETKQLLDFLLIIVVWFQPQLKNSIYSSDKILSTNACLWEVQMIAFTMIGDLYSRAGSSLPVDVWQSTIEVLRSILDLMASKGPLVEDSVMAMFYNSLLNCLHFVLVDPRGSLSGHVAGLVAILKMFLHYGLNNKSNVAIPVVDHNKFKSVHKKQNTESAKPYRPPHLRNKNFKNRQQIDEESPSSSERDECLTFFHPSSDSENSDSDGSGKDGCYVRYAKTRLAAILCIQDLCRADPKSFTTQWTNLLPSSDVLQPRRYEATLMSCLLFDPYMKARITSASTIRAMLDAPSSVFLQVAEFKESTRRGSFTALSSSLGQILMQLHTGILYLIKHETHSGLLVSLFKILMLLVSCTPYSRMPPELLPTIISSIHSRIEEGFSLRSDQNILLVAAINCLSAALSSSAFSTLVKDMLLAEMSAGFVTRKSGVLSVLFQYSEPETSPSISVEALQALKTLAHSHPTITVMWWGRVSSLMYAYLSSSTDIQNRSWRDNVPGEKVITAAIKVLDECLRAASGFKGTEDLFTDKSLDSPFTSDYVKTKTISSAPTYEMENNAPTKDEAETLQGSERWLEVIDRHMPLILNHSSPMVRAASVTCFAGITSSVFFSLPKAKQDFILYSSISAAVTDEVPSVRSAACRAIGVIACFPQIFDSAEILEKFICAAEHNSHDTLVSVRITASWALANICDALRHHVNVQSFNQHSLDSKASFKWISLLIDSSLRLAKDNDKIKANAVRALGNLSRFVPLTSNSSAYYRPNKCTGHLMHSSVQSFQISDDPRNNPNSDKKLLEESHWLEKMVQTFLSCVSTGNVKVQWNVCHALSNLFFNETLNLQDMDWAPSVFSILLLLLRNSSNFKIRIQAAAALAVPATINDYGRSFVDVLQGIEHVIENLRTDQISALSNLKYRVALEKQLTSTMLHVLALSSQIDDHGVPEFLGKKSSFLEEWFKGLCLSLRESNNELEAEYTSNAEQKKDIICRAIKSLIEVFEAHNLQAIAQKFYKLSNNL
ncbi:HEAT repeat-containing protein 6 [Ipomoea triloba]|uniref:HEAT repeat-containing protein 6 n=1 Tax=Ipomoea triloba TaxID=35885 RepID=UPI00125D9910|nr:HEAT repeat-containing protein 6 [Ipomoea triloba]XP_031094138.1 HEAT repeat-containing protein 6 [Ipomoea triloba]